MYTVYHKLRLSTRYAAGDLEPWPEDEKELNAWVRSLNHDGE